jgi:hypothetical protein
MTTICDFELAVKTLRVSARSFITLDRPLRGKTATATTNVRLACKGRSFAATRTDGEVAPITDLLFSCRSWLA